MNLGKIEPKILSTIIISQRQGRPLEEIAKFLNNLQIASPEAESQWTERTVCKVLAISKTSVHSTSEDGDI